jgi:hypothetical protein
VKAEMAIGKKSGQKFVQEIQVLTERKQNTSAFQRSND